MRVVREILKITHTQIKIKRNQLYLSMPTKRSPEVGMISAHDSVFALQDLSVLGSVNVLSIHERYAYDLFSWGDYEGAVGHFLVAETPIDHVLSLFPSLAPPEFVPPNDRLQGGWDRCLVVVALLLYGVMFRVVSPLPSRARKKEGPEIA